MPIPPLALLLSFWLHMLATVIWLGSLAALAIFILPSMRHSLKPADYANGVVSLNRRLDPLGWFCLGLLTFTGLLQMDSSSSYQGLFIVSNAWSMAMCAKHIVFLGMIVVSGYLNWSVAPGLQAAAIQRARGKRAVDQLVLRRFQVLITVNLVLGVLVLVFTALARIS